MGLVRESEVLTYLGMTSTATEDDLALVAMLKPMVDSRVSGILGFYPGRDTHTEYVPTHPPDVVVDPFTEDVVTVWFPEAGRIRLKHRPVVSVANVWVNTAAHGIDEAFTDEHLLDPGYYYFDRRGFLLSGNYAFPATPGSIKVVYTAGLTPAELGGVNYADIKEAALMIFASSFAESKRLRNAAASGGAGPIVGERWPDYEVRFAQPLAVNQGAVVTPPGAYARLERHIRYDA